MVPRGAWRSLAMVARGGGGGEGVVRHQDQRRGADHAEMGEVGDRVVAVPADQGVGRDGVRAALGEHDRVAIGGLPAEPVRGDHAGDAGPVLHHDLRAGVEMGGHAIGEEAGGDIGGAAGRIAAHQGDGSGGRRETLGLDGRRRGNG